MRVLIVDDEEPVREFLTEAVVQYGYEAVSASNGREGLETFKSALESEEPFSVVVSDLRMPLLNGDDLLLSLLALGVSARLALVTGEISEEAKVFLERRGIAVFLKPVKLVEFWNFLDPRRG